MDWQIEREVPEWMPRPPGKHGAPPKLYVRINGEIFLYGTKAPYVPSGCSISGGIEYRRVDDKLRCHECGEWYKNLGTHSHNAHGITAAEYKRKHGLRRKTSLVNEKVRVSCIKRMVALNKKNGGSPVNLDPALRLKANEALASGHRNGTFSIEERNGRMLCQAQVIARVRALADELGRTPTLLELEAADLPIWKVKFALHCSNAAEAMRICGLMPRSKDGSPFTGYTREMCITLFENFVAVNQRRPTCSDMKRGVFPPYSVIYRLFGGGIGALAKSVENADRPDHH